jgi:F-type H+-transporting ATPase subunit b
MLTWQLILIQLVTFILIVLFLRWLLYSHVSRALKKLHRLNQQNLAKEKALKDELERAKKQAENEIARGKEKANSIKKKIKVESEQEAEKIVDTARNEAKRIIEEGKRASQLKVNEMASKMEEKAAYLALDIVRYVLSEDIKESLQKQIVDEVISEIDTVSPEKLKVKDGAMELISAFELEAKQKDKLKSILSSKLNKDISFSSRIDKTVVAGMILRSGGIVIDGSMKNKFKKVFSLIKEQAKESS